MIIQDIGKTYFSKLRLLNLDMNNIFSLDGIETMQSEMLQHLSLSNQPEIS